MNFERIANFLRVTITAGAAMSFVTACEAQVDPNFMQVVDYQGRYITSRGKHFDAVTTVLLFKNIDPNTQMRCVSRSSNLDYIFQHGVREQTLDWGTLEAGSCQVKAVRPYRPSSGRR